AGELVVYSNNFLQEQHLPLAALAFPANQNTLPAFHDESGLTNLGQGRQRFQRVHVESRTQAVIETDLGAFPGYADPRALLAPDDKTFLYWGAAGEHGDDCVLGVRDFSTGLDLWAQALCVDPTIDPVFVKDGDGWRPVVLLGDRLVGLDARTGA